jgi:hypothetical protein
MSGAEDFEWTFPCYVLRRNAQIDPATAVITIEFAAATIDEGGGTSTLIFTDLDLAERYMTARGDTGFVPLVLKDTSALKKFLTSAGRTKEAIVVDLDFRSGLGRKFYIDTLMKRLEDK